MEPNEISTMIQSPTFWFATVFVSLIVSMVGNYLYELTQKIWANFSKKQAEKNTAKQKAFDKLVKEAHERGIRTSDMEIHSIFKSLWNILFLFVLLIFALFINSISNGLFIYQAAGLIIWVILMIIANRSINEAAYDRKLINAVRNLDSEFTQDQTNKE